MRNFGAEFADAVWNSAVDDVKLVLSITDGRVLEVAGQIEFRITLNCSPAKGMPNSASYSNVDGTANSADADYVGESGSIAFLPCQT